MPVMYQQNSVNSLLVITNNYQQNSINSMLVTLAVFSSNDQQNSINSILVMLNGYQQNSINSMLVMLNGYQQNSINSMLVIINFVLAKQQKQYAINVKKLHNNMLGLVMYQQNRMLLFLVQTVTIVVLCLHSLINSILANNAISECVMG